MKNCTVGRWDRKVGCDLVDWFISHFWGLPPLSSTCDTKKRRISGDERRLRGGRRRILVREPGERFCDFILSLQQHAKHHAENWEDVRYWSLGKAKNDTTVDPKQFVIFNSGTLCN